LFINDLERLGSSGSPPSSVMICRFHGSSLYL
jgi:hypothetical protein